jgi:hypothetical protein
MAAIDAVVKRLETGQWGETTAEGLNAAARALNREEPRYVTYIFRTPFNRAFYKDSKRPF